MRAVSEVVAILVMLVITAGLAGSAWLFVDQYFSGIATEPAHVFGPPPGSGENQPPAVEIDPLPAIVAGDVGVLLRFSDPDGAVRTVELWAENSANLLLLIGREGDPPGSSTVVLWDTDGGLFQDDTYKLIAIATDERGAAARDEATVVVDNVEEPNTEPVITILDPDGFPTPKVSNTITIRGEAWDPDDNLDPASLAVAVTDAAGTTSLGPATLAQNGQVYAWSVDWDTQGGGNGPATITAGVADLEGLTDQDTQDVQVDNGETLLFEQGGGDPLAAAAAVDAGSLAPHPLTGHVPRSLAGLRGGVNIGIGLSPASRQLYQQEVGFQHGIIRLLLGEGDVNTPFTQWENLASQIVAAGGKPMVRIAGLPDYQITIKGQFHDYGQLRYHPSCPMGMPADRWEAGAPVACTAQSCAGWYAYVKDVVAFYALEGVRHFELWNEPNEPNNWQCGIAAQTPETADDTTMDNFILLFRWAERAVRDAEADPSTNPRGEKFSVAGPATSAFGGKICFPDQVTCTYFIDPATGGSPFLEGLTQQGALLDLYSFHHYNPTPAADPGRTDAYQLIRSFYPDILFYADEFNDAIPPLYDDERNAAWAGAFLADLVRTGVEYQALYALYNSEVSGSRDDPACLPAGQGTCGNGVCEEGESASCPGDCPAGWSRRYAGCVRPALNMVSMWDLRKAVANTYRQLTLLAKDQVEAQITGNPAVTGFASTDGGRVTVFLASYASPQPTAATVTIAHPPQGDLRYTRTVVDSARGNIDALQAEMLAYFGAYGYQGVCDPAGQAVAPPADLGPWLAFHHNNCQLYRCPGGGCACPVQDRLQVGEFCPAADIEHWNARTESLPGEAASGTIQDVGPLDVLQGTFSLEPYSTTLLVFEPA